MPAEACVCVQKGHIFRSLKYLNHSLVFIDFHNTPQLAATVLNAELHDFIESCVFDALQNHQRAIDFT